MADKYLQSNSRKKGLQHSQFYFGKWLFTLKLALVSTSYGIGLNKKI